MRRATPDILGDVLAATVGEEVRGALVWLPLARFYDNPFQPRASYDDVESLADSIWSLRGELPATLGLQQPPVARVVAFNEAGDAMPVERGVYGDPAAVRRLALSDKHAVELHFGHRRLRAWRLLRQRDEAYAEFPVMLAYADDLSMWRHVVAENAQRKDINALEEAQTLQVAIQRFNLTQEQAGEPFGFARATVANKLRLLGLPESFRVQLAAGAITERHARALLRLAPAPQLWPVIEWDAQANLSVAQLEEMIDVLIGRCRPLAPARNTGYKHASEGYYGGVRKWGVSTQSFNPPAWPYDWEPQAKVNQGIKIEGACSSCKYRATFGGDAGARCTLLDRSHCYDAKTRQWEAEQRAAQAEALKRPVSVSQETPTATPTAASAGSVSQETPTAASVAAPISRLEAQIAADRETSFDMRWFSTASGYVDAPAVLLERGLCSAQKCGCMVVAYKADAQEHHVRPDAEHAPNMCVGCTSPQRLANRRKELELGDLHEHRKRVKAEQELAARLLSDAFDSYGAAELWQNRVIVGAIVQNTVQIDQRYKLKDADLAQLQWTIFEGCARARCQVYEGSQQKWSVEKVEAWLREVATAAGREVATAQAAEPDEKLLVNWTEEDWASYQNGQPVSRPAASPGRRWEEDWSDVDEALYQELVMDWDGRSWQSLAAKATRMTNDDPLGITPAVLRRLAQECPEVTLSGHLGSLADRWLRE